MANNPEVSVLTIVHNGERYVGRAIDSILNQTYRNFEYILVDNNSTDSTPKILSDYAQKDERIRIISESEQGVLYARNAGLRIAKGDWVAVLDADDIALPNRLECQLSFVKENPTVILVGGGCTLIDRDGEFLKSYTYPTNHESLVRHLENEQAFFPHSSAFFNRQVVAELGGYRFPHAEDADLWLRLSMQGEIACLNQPLIKLRRSVSSRSYNISQEPYILFNLVGLVCHFRRKEGLSDLYSVKEKWDDFLAWTKMRMETLNCFEKGKAKRELYRIWYSKGSSKLHRVFRMIYLSISNRSARAFLLDRSYIQSAAVQIAEESKGLFQKNI